MEGEREEKKSMRYSEAMARLQEILDRIDSSDVDIDELAERVKEASELIRFCKSLLTTAEKSVAEALQGLEEDETAGG